MFAKIFASRNHFYEGWNPDSPQWLKFERITDAGSQKYRKYWKYSAVNISGPLSELGSRVVFNGRDGEEGQASKGNIYVKSMTKWIAVAQMRLCHIDIWINYRSVKCKGFIDRNTYSFVYGRFWVFQGRRVIGEHALQMEESKTYTYIKEKRNQVTNFTKNESHLMF